MDAEVRLPDRVAVMERFNPAAFVSLHCNSSEAPEATGIETYYRHDNGQKLARSIHERLVAATGRPDRGVRNGRLYVLRGERVPATLVEMGFISSHEEETRLLEPAYQKVLARAIAEGIKTYLDSRPALSAGDGALALSGGGTAQTGR
jgi:N-acetylmuramoyl-L-alanine amidase